TASLTTSRRSSAGRRPASVTLWRGMCSCSLRVRRAKGRIARGAIMTNLNQSDGKAFHFIDDLHVGQRFGSGREPIGAEQIKAFARQFDPQPFHLDSEAAKDTLFQGLAASGWHTAAVTMRLLVETGLPIAGGIIGAGAEISWPNPTRPGDVLQVES